MSNMDTTLANTSANQDLFVELDAESAETISGGALERFRITNRSNTTIPYTVDGVRTRYPNNGQTSIWTTFNGGTVAFDYDFLRPGVQLRRYNLANGRRYEFQRDTRTAYRGDINLYDVGRL